MSYYNVTDFAPNSPINKALNKQKTKERKILHEHREQTILRKHNKSVQNAWEQYMIVIQLAKDEKQ